MSSLLDLPPETPRRRRPRRGRRLAAVLLVLVLMLAGALVGGRVLLDRLGTDPVADYEGAGTGEVVVVVEPGETAAQVAATLEEAGVVRSTAAFNQAALADPEESRKLQPGSYALRRQMSGQAALERLLDPASRVQGTVVVPEGLRVEQTLKRIEDATDIPLADLQAAAARPQALGLPAYAEGELEGFLFPATYQVEPGTTAAELLTTMVARFRQAATDVGLEQGARAIGRTPYEVVTVASLIEREVRFDDELPKVAQVVYNRLEQGERLDIDAAVLYGLGRTSGGLTRSDLDKDTPYNLRKIRGLPPTPISSPGEETLRAALNPTGGDILFYVLSSKEGRSTFTSTLAEHNRAVAKAKSEGVF